jgi:CheY-like chemotaxis protein
VVNTVCPRILALLEEDKNSRQVVESLTRSGHNVVLVQTFPKAIDVFEQQHKIDLVISDVHLENGGNVFDFLRWMKRNPATSAIPFVLFSSHPTEAAKYLEDGVRVSARMLGAAKYITMGTFDSHEFRKQIDSLLPGIA